MYHYYIPISSAVFHCHAAECRLCPFAAAAQEGRPFLCLEGFFDLRKFKLNGAPYFSSRRWLNHQQANADAHTHNSTLKNDEAAGRFFCWRDTSLEAVSDMSHDFWPSLSMLSSFIQFKCNVTRIPHLEM